MSTEAGVSELDHTTVAAVMSARLLTVDANTSLLEARDLLQREHVHHLLIHNENGVVAILSDRDLLRAVSPFLGTIGEQPRDFRTLLRPVFQFATYHPVTVRSDASVYEAAALLLDHAISCLPVVDARGQVVGVVTTRDLIRGLLACALPRADGMTSNAA